MNKKFLSAILFGALMVSSTGTFVSCKDYDDDIKDLQGQIDSNKNAIAALQKLVGEGKWVTSISPITNGFTITMSDGSSQTVTGINGKDGEAGKDGKPGTEWTIGEDGFWYKDGEKTDAQAVAKDGEDGKPGTNGQTAPSPEIVDGKWVVYSWNAEKGEFEKKETGVSAQGTGAFYVEKDGVIYLNIANEAGVFDKAIALPTTSDGFVAEAPYSKVVVKYETAKWNKWNANKDEAKTLLKKYPELANIAKDAPMKQGGNLPILVTPANVELTDAFSFALQGLDGKIADIKISTPIKGLPVNTTIIKNTISVWFDDNSNGQQEKGEIRDVYTGASYMQTRAAENDCFWSVKVDPAYDATKKKYAEAENSSLSVTNAKGTTVKTTFAYNVECDDISKDVEVSSSNTSVEYAASIDVFAKQGDKKPIFTKSNDYVGYVVLEATNALQVEKYKLSVDGSKLIIGNMPANENSISVALKVTVVGLNGSVASTTADVSIAQSVGAESSLSAKTATLSKDAVKVRWNMSELNMSAIQLDQLMKGKVQFFIGRLDADDNKYYVAYNGNVKFYNAKDEEVTYSNGKWSAGGNESAATTFGLDIKANTIGTGVTENKSVSHNKETYIGEKWMPKEYIVEMTSLDDNTVVFSATTTLKVSNPATTATYIKLVPAFVEDNVFQITGTVANGKVTYKLADGLILNNGAALKGFIDMDNKDYIDNGGDTNDKAAYGNYNWLVSDQSANKNAELSVNVWKTKAQVGNSWTAAEYNQLYTERKIRAIYTLFGNSKNIVPFDYFVKVKSEIFNDKPAEAIIMDATKLSAVFGGKDGANTIDIQKAITKALVAAGTDKGKTYELFATAGGKNKYKDYTTLLQKDGYVVTAAGKPITIKADDLMDMGMSMDQYIAYTSAKDKPTYYLKVDKTYYYGDKGYDNQKDAETAAEAVAVAGLPTLPDDASDDKKAEAAKNAAAAKKAEKAKIVVLYGWNDLYTVYKTYYKLDTENGKYVFNTASGVPSADKIPATESTLISLFNSYNSLTKFEDREGTVAQNGTSVDSRITNVVIAFADALEATKYFQKVVTSGVVSGTKITAVDSAPADVTGGKVIVPMKISVTDIWGKTMVRTFDVTVTTK